MDFEQTSTRKLIFKRKKKRVPLIYKSLSVLLYSLQGEQIVVEQKNDSEVTGVIASAGHGMDLTLADAILTSKSGIKSEHEEYCLFGGSIRYVHLPPSLNIAKHLNSFVAIQESSSHIKSMPRLLNDRKRKSDLY